MLKVAVIIPPFYDAHNVPFSGQLAEPPRQSNQNELTNAFSVLISRAMR
jgi:hypothetical protein